eukprot:gene5129-3548_t
MLMTTSTSHFRGMESKAAVPSPTKPLFDPVVRYTTNASRPGLKTHHLMQNRKSGGLQASISATHFVSAGTQLQLPSGGVQADAWLLPKKKASRYGGAGSGWFTRLAAPIPRVTGNIRNNDGSDGKGENDLTRTKKWATPQTLWGAGCNAVALPQQMGTASAFTITKVISAASLSSPAVPLQLPSIRSSPPRRLGFRVAAADLAGTACFSEKEEDRGYGRRHLASHTRERLLW